MITLAFYKGWRLRPKYLLQDGGIRLATWGKYSHEEFIAEKAELGGTYTCFSSSARRGGVGVAQIHLHPKRWDLVHLDIDPDPCIARFNEINGLPYDWWGALFSALPFGQVNDPNAWFCSEACSFMIGEGRSTPSPNAHHHSFQS